VLKLKEDLKVGDTITVLGKKNSPVFKKANLNFTQTVESMQIEHEPIQKANPGDLIGLQVIEEVHEGCCVFKKL